MVEERLHKINSHRNVETFYTVVPDRLPDATRKTDIVIGIEIPLEALLVNVFV